jgi:hypothetical protein
MAALVANVLICRSQCGLQPTSSLKAVARPTTCWKHRRMDQTTGQDSAEQQIAVAMAAEHESLNPRCRADPARFERLLAADFHEFGSSGGEIGYEGTAARIAAATNPDDEPIRVENMRGWLLGDGLVMLKYASENQGRRANRTSLWRRTANGRWQVFHH